MSAVDDLKVAFRRFRHVSKQGKAAPPEDSHAFISAMTPLLAAAAPHIEAHEFIHQPCNRMPWTASDIELQAGDELSLISVGRMMLSKPLDIWVGPQFGVWGRVGELGHVFNGQQDTHSITASEEGRLFICNQFPGQFAEPIGRVQPSLNDYAAMEGEFMVLAIRWKGDAKTGLEAMRAVGDHNGLIKSELDRLANPSQAPEGWQNLWFLGDAGIFKPEHKDGHDCIHCNTSENVGILQKEISMPLNQDTEISWDWNVSQLPSDLPENTLPSHDYLSVAVEFENGRDITYHWSREMPVGKGYWCPLPTWKDREFHVVLRSGEEGLGQWLSEKRNLYQDHLSYMGEPPKRIVRVWLIAVSIFQRNQGVMDVRNIQLGSDKIL